MAGFDPDAYLASASFDPDAYLAQAAPKPISSPVAVSSPESKSFRFLPKSGAQTDVAEGRDVFQGPVPPFVRGLGSAVGEVIPRSIGQDIRMAGEAASPAVGAIEDVIREPQQVEDVYQGLQQGKSFQDAVADVLGRQKTYPEFNAEDWG